jgi:hypothetical protein
MPKLGPKPASVSIHLPTPTSATTPFPAATAWKATPTPVGKIRTQKISMSNSRPGVTHVDFVKGFVTVLMPISCTNKGFGLIAITCGQRFDVLEFNYFSVKSVVVTSESLRS